MALDKSEHEDFMRRVIQLACQNLKRPFAALIVDPINGEIISEGLNRNYKDPTCHAEIVAISKAATTREENRWGDYVLYTTAEPNPMNMAALLWSGIGTVVYGTSMDKLDELGFRQINIPAQEVIDRAKNLNCTLIPGVCAEESDALFSAAAKFEKVH